MKIQVKGQSTLEMIFSYGMLLIVFSIMIMLAMNKTAQSSELKTFLDVKRVGLSVKANIDTISQEGPGYSKFFILPVLLQGGHEYNVSVRSNVLTITWADKVWSTQLATTNVVAHSLDKGGNRMNLVSNNGGVVELSSLRANLQPDCGSLVYESNGSWMNITFNVLNAGHQDSMIGSSAGFMQTHLGVQYSMVYPYTMPVSSFSDTIVNLTVEDLGSGETIFTLVADVFDEVNESIESDNHCNITFIR